MLLKTFREKKHLTQKEVAEKIGISLRHYQRIESGQYFLRKEKLQLLEDIFKVPHRVLLAKSVEEVPDFLKNYLFRLF